MAAPAVGGPEGGQLSGGGSGGPGDFCCLKGFNVLVRVVQHRVEVGHQVHQIVVNAADLPAHGPGELAHGVFGRRHGLRVDQVHHGLGLGQIHLAVEEGPAGKLPGQSLAGAGGKEGLQPGGQHGGGATE